MIWSYKRFWKGTGLSVVRTCFQPWRTVPVGSILLLWQRPGVPRLWLKTPVGSTGLQGKDWRWELQSICGTNCPLGMEVDLQISMDKTVQRTVKRIGVKWTIIMSLNGRLCLFLYFTYVVLVCFPGFTTAPFPEERFPCSPTVWESWWLEEVQLFKGT